MELVRPNHLLQAGVRIRSAEGAGECARAQLASAFGATINVFAALPQRRKLSKWQIRVCHGHKEAFRRGIDPKPYSISRRCRILQVAAHDCSNLGGGLEFTQAKIRKSSEMPVPQTDQARNLAIACSFHPAPLPGRFRKAARQASFHAQGLTATIGFHQFAYSSQCEPAAWRSATAR